MCRSCQVEAIPAADASSGFDQHQFECGTHARQNQESNLNLREFNFLPCILFGNMIVFQGQCVQVVWQRRIRRSAVVSKFEFVRPGWEWLSDASRIGWWFYRGLDTLEPAKFPFLAGRPLEWHVGWPRARRRKEEGGYLNFMKKAYLHGHAICILMFMIIQSLGSTTARCCCRNCQQVLKPGTTRSCVDVRYSPETIDSISLTRLYVWS